MRRQIEEGEAWPTLTFTDHGGWAVEVPDDLYERYERAAAAWGEVQGELWALMDERRRREELASDRRWAEYTRAQKAAEDARRLFREEAVAEARANRAKATQVDWLGWPLGFGL